VRASTVPVATKVPKVAISIRLRRETLQVYRRTGKGWQTRLSDDLDRLALAYRHPATRTR
jgi:uncharacterized protein (DUF4415 family)